MTPIDLDQADAMTVAIVVTDAFTTLDVNGGGVPDLARGAVLLYDAILRRIEPLLPRDNPGMKHVFDAIAQARATADGVRRLHGLQVWGEHCD